MARWKVFLPKLSSRASGHRKLFDVGMLFQHAGDGFDRGAGFNRGIKEHMPVSDLESRISKEINPVMTEIIVFV